MHVRKHVWIRGWSICSIRQSNQIWCVCMGNMSSWPKRNAKCRFALDVVCKDRRAKPFHIPIQQQFPLIVTTCSDKLSIFKCKSSGWAFGVPWISCHSIRPHCYSHILFGTEWSHKRVNQELGAEYHVQLSIPAWSVSVAVLVKYVPVCLIQQISACLSLFGKTFANSDLSHCDAVTYFIPRFCPCHFLMESITTSWKHTMSVYRWIHTYLWLKCCPTEHVFIAAFERHIYVTAGVLSLVPANGSHFSQNNSRTDG